MEPSPARFYPEEGRPDPEAPQVRTRRPSFLSLLPAAESRTLAWGATRRRIARDEVLFLSGEPCDRIYLIKHGLIKLCVRDPEGRQGVLDVVAGGDLLGASSAILREPHHHDAIGVTGASVLALDAGSTLRALSARPETARALLSTLAREARNLAQMSIERTSGSIRARVAGRLLHLSDLLGADRAGTIDVRLPLCQEELGHFAGVSRERTNRELNRLRRLGVLEYGDGRLRIYRRDVLERLRCGERVAVSSRSTGGGGRAPALSRWDI